MVAGLTQFVRWQNPELHVSELRQREGGAAGPAGSAGPAGTGGAFKLADGSADFTTAYEDDVMQVGWCCRCTACLLPCTALYCHPASLSLAPDLLQHRSPSGGSP